MNLSDKFASALPHDDFLSRYATAEQRSRWDAVGASITLSEAQLETLRGFRRELNVLCMAGAWCGDCIEQCPIFRRFELASPKIRLRYVDRDHDEELRSSLTICGAPRVPQTILMNEDFEPLLRGPDRPLSKYRRLASQLLGATCPTGLSVDAELQRAAVSEWLDLFEHAHLIARLSPRLRARHGD